ncbi:tagaturonate epimerase family protein [bacterium]|nr:tagaturonate epimerase family protein [bacterium]
MCLALANLMDNAGYQLYEKSLRRIDNQISIFTVVRHGRKLVGMLGPEHIHRLADETGPARLRLSAEEKVTLHPLTWENYVRLRQMLPLAPSICGKAASFGTGDRLGMVSAAHLEADNKFQVFPVIAQQSPRELERTNRTFKSVLLDAVMGVLESGYTGSFGADADHIKNDTQFMEGVEAGYSMFTLDVSDNLLDISSLSASEINDAANNLTELSRGIAKRYAEKTISLPGEQNYTFSEDELIRSALVYEKSMLQAVRFCGMARTKLDEFDLEISIDEGSRETTPEDHLFVAEFLHANNVDFTSLAPKFPGQFQKAVDYKGNYAELKRSFSIHGELARLIGGYRLSMHSGSDKFSIYEIFAEMTRGNFHIKTSGTSWLQAVRLIAHTNLQLFKDMYDICIETLPESKKAYHVDITPTDFPNKLPYDAIRFFGQPNVQQLFHISYGALLDAKRPEILDTLHKNEQQHYAFVTEHIERHLKLAFNKKGEKSPSLLTP